MIDLGLTTGIKDLWQENLLCDYTIVVEGHELKVHKVVLAAVSQYFKVMFSQDFAESKMDKVEVKGFSSSIVSKVIDFIYPGEESIIVDDTLGILQCAIYLQMPLVADFCVKKLMERLSIQNWSETVAVLMEYTFQDKVEAIKHFVRANWQNVMENYNPEEISYEALSVLINNWQGTEWDLFGTIKNWIFCDYDSRIGRVNNLMSVVRFGLLSEMNIQVIMELDIFTTTDKPWKDLVKSAWNYLRLPMHQKVLDTSEQSRVRREPLPTFFISNHGENSVGFYALDEGKWRKREETLKISGMKTVWNLDCIEVNNFLIFPTLTKDVPHWHIFNPRTMKWATMAAMETLKTNFKVVHHNGQLYALGGRVQEEISNDMQQYSFQSGEWISEYKLPTPLTDPLACVLGDLMYMAGGAVYRGAIRDTVYTTDGLYCLDLSTGGKDWEKKASCLSKVGCDDIMAVVQRGGKEALFILNIDLNIQIYSPSQDQWTTFSNYQRPYLDYEVWLQDAAVIIKENSLITFNMCREDEDESTDPCLHWTVPEKGSHMTADPVPDFPNEACQRQGRYFAAMVAFSPQYKGKELKP